MKKIFVLSINYFVVFIVGVGCVLSSNTPGSVAFAQISVFKSSFESKENVLHQFQLDKIEKYAWSLTTKHKNHGDKGLLIRVDKGYKFSHNTERSEFQDPLKISLNEEVWYRIDFKIPTEFPEVDNRLVIWQLKQSGSNNPLIAMYYRGGKLSLKQSFDSSQINYYQPNENYKNKWIRIVIHAKASHSSAGFFNVLLDDSQIVQYNGQTAHHNQSEENTYFKFGLYRDVIDTPMYMYYDQYVRGYSWHDVVPENDNFIVTKNLWRFFKKEKS